jgi:hypothetical protein
MLFQTLVWTVAVEVVFVLPEHSAGVLLVVDQHPVAALDSDASHEAFRERVGPSCQLHPMCRMGGLFG